MDNIELLKSTVKGLNYRYSAIKKINNLMGESSGVHDFLDKAVGMVMDIIGAEAGIIFTKERDNTLKASAVRAQLPYEKEKQLKEELENNMFSLEETGLEKILDGSEPLIIQKGEDIDSLKYVRVIADAVGRVDMFCAVPVIKDDRVSGAVVLFNIPGDLRDDKKEAFASIGGQIGVYMELFMRLSDLKKRAATLRQMVSITEAISSPSQMGSVLDLIIKNSLDFFDAEGCSILLKDKDGNLRFEAVSGDKADLLKGETLNAGEGIVGQVVDTGQVKLAVKAEEDSSFSPRIDGITRMKTGSVICAPLKVADQVTGAIEVIRTESGRPFTEEDTGLLVILASHASITIEKAKMYTMKEKWFNSTIGLLIKMINAKDERFPEHTDKVRELCRLMGENIGLEGEQLQHLDIAASIQNIAKLIIPDSILKKDTKLSEQEWEEIVQHPVKSAGILETLDEFRDVIPIIKYHHEKYDGTGYPEGLRGKEIPRLARILNIADSYTAMTSPRPYRKAMSHEEALENIRSEKGKQYDPELAELFVNLLESADKKE
ncbi:MAG: GAF domain-containing protein [Elusimicrobiota bacterium]|nr:GAF domain-containing protein [Elusimicrobiota bacterium]